MSRGVPDREPVMLSIAGSDSSGGAGVQADLKTATAMGVYAATVLTALTAQNTRGVHGIHPVPAAFVREQLRAVGDDLDVRAVKIGMLGEPQLVEVVAEAIDALGGPERIAVVLDPVMVATSGDRLLPEAAEAAVRDLLVPRATVVTPNLPEAAVLTGTDDPAGAGAALVAAGARWALVKGGHATGPEVVDLLVSAHGTERLAAPRIDTAHTHGTGCTLSAGIAARLAVGDEVAAAVSAARDYLRAALASGRDRAVGGGHVPVDHLVGLRGRG